MTTLLDLPNDILRHYILEMDVSLIVCRFVCKRFKNLIPLSIEISKKITVYAASNGYLNILTWAIFLGAPMKLRNFCWHHVYIGDRNVLLGLYENTERFTIAKKYNYYLESKEELEIDNIAAHAAFKGHLDVLKWIHDSLRNVTEIIIDFAFIAGHIHIIDWALNVGILEESDCPYNMYDYIPLNNHWHMVKWMIDRQIWNEFVNIMLGYLISNSDSNLKMHEMLTYAFTAKFKFSDRPTFGVIAGNRIDVLNLLYDNNQFVMPESSQVNIKYEIANNRPEIYNWLIEKKIIDPNAGVSILGDILEN